MIPERFCPLPKIILCAFLKDKGTVEGFLFEEVLCVNL
jgi:hypothetical protein